MDKVPSEPDATHPDAVHVVFKLPSGGRLERRFLKSHSLEVSYFNFFIFNLRIYTSETTYLDLNIRV